MILLISVPPMSPSKSSSILSVSTISNTGAAGGGSFITVKCFSKIGTCAPSSSKTSIKTLGFVVSLITTLVVVR